MKAVVHRIESIDQIDQLAEDFLAEFKSPTTVLFTGEMGVGKTTFITALCRILGTDTQGSSPTFSLVNEYTIAISGRPVYHFDCYRLNTPEEALDFGIEEYFDSGDWCFVEWPEKLGPYLPKDALNINMTMESEVRFISWEK